MSRLPQLDPASMTGKSAELARAVQQKLGLVPNMVRAMANSPAVLEAYVAFSSALAHGHLGARLGEQIALQVAEANDCSYCLSAHCVIGGKVGLAKTELAAAREGRSGDARAQAALTFVRALLVRDGAVSDDDLAAVRAAGYDDGQIAEIVATVALNVFTNMFNRAVGTDIEFPVVRAGARVG